MDLELDQFRDVDLVIDRANDSFVQKQFVSQGDYGGRSLTVQVTNNGNVGEVPGLTLNLRWQNQSSGVTDLTAFYVVNKQSSVFRIDYPQNMLTPGNVVASIQVLQDGKTTFTKEFSIFVQRLAGEPVGILEKAEFGALVAVLSDSNRFRTDINQLGAIKADVDYVDQTVEQVQSGFIGEYASTTELTNAYPSGRTGFAVIFETVSGVATGYMYTWRNNAWTKGNVFGGNVVPDRTITPNKTSFFITGKNLFDKSKAVDGMYVLYTNGKLDTNPSFFATGFIPVQPNTTYTKNDNQQLAFYRTASTEDYISGLASATTFTTPAGCYFLRATVRIASKNTFQLEVGTTSTDYEEYGMFLTEASLSKEIVDKLNSNNSGYGVVKVAKQNGEFDKISSAITAIKSNGKRKTIELYPGDYEEVALLASNQFVDIVGKNKRTTKIIDKSGDYANCPLQVSGEGFFKDFTVIANHDNVTGSLPATTSYAAHIDYVGAGTLIFEDIDFESYQNSAVGIGMHQNQTIIFRRCRFYIDSTRGAAFYAHCNVNSGVTNQRLILEDCVIISEKSDAIRLDDSNIIFGDGLGNEMEVTFINNYFYSIAKGSPSIVIYNDPISEEYLCGHIKLDPMSHGNNIDILNAY